MDLKEFLIDVLAIALGFVIAGIIKSKLPASLGGSTWEESYEESEVR
jgi:hypothetical protein